MGKTLLFSKQKGLFTGWSISFLSVSLFYLHFLGLNDTVLSSESIRFVRDIFAASADSINLCGAAQVAMRVSPPTTQLIKLLMQVQERQCGVQCHGCLCSQSRPLCEETSVSWLVYRGSCRSSEGCKQMKKTKLSKGSRNLGASLSTSCVTSDPYCSGASFPQEGYVLE